MDGHARHRVESAYLLIGALAGTFGQVDIGLLQHNVGIAAANTFDRCHSDWHLTVTIDVGIQDTQNMLELLWDNQGLQSKEKISAISVSFDRMNYHKHRTITNLNAEHFHYTEHNHIRIGLHCNWCFAANGKNVQEKFRENSIKTPN